MTHVLNSFCRFCYWIRPSFVYQQLLHESCYADCVLSRHRAPTTCTGDEASRGSYSAAILLSPLRECSCIVPAGLLACSLLQQTLPCLLGNIPQHNWRKDLQGRDEYQMPLVNAFTSAGKLFGLRSWNGRIVWQLALEGEIPLTQLKVN